MTGNDSKKLSMSKGKNWEAMEEIVRKNLQQMEKEERDELMSEEQGTPLGQVISECITDVDEALAKMEWPARAVCNLHVVKLDSGGFYYYSNGLTSPRVYFGPDLGDALSHFLHQFANEKNLVWSSDNKVAQAHGVSGNDDLLDEVETDE